MLYTLSFNQYSYIVLLLVMYLGFAEIRMFEVFLRTYEVTELKVDTGSMVGENQDANNEGSRPSKRYHHFT